MRRLADIGLYKVSSYLRKTAPEEYLQKYEHQLCPTDIPLEEYCRSSYSQLEDAEDDIAWNIQQLWELLNHDAVAMTFVELCVLAYAEPYVYHLYQYIAAQSSNGISIALAFTLTFPEYDFLTCLDDLKYTHYLLKEIFVFSEQNPDFYNETINPDFRIIDFINGSDEVCAVLKPYCKVFFSSEELPPSILYEEKAIQIYQNLQNIADAFIKQPIIHISGAADSGKRFLVKRISKYLNVNLLLVDFSVFQDTIVSIKEFICLIRRELILLNACLCIYNIREIKEMELQNFFSLLSYHLDKDATLPTFFLTDFELNIQEYVKNYVIPVPLTSPDYHQRKCVWDYFSEVYLHREGREFPCGQELAIKMKLPVGLIKKTVKSLSATPEKAEDILYVQQLIRLFSTGKATPALEKMTVPYTLDDLKLPEQEKNTLVMITNHMKYKYTVYETFNMKSKYPYGRSISVLFSGPPGTGKTMAAYVLSNMLGLELYKINISQIVDKYVGETEKHLEKVFGLAERTNMILFFDEADAIFSKRSQINDSKDKYANVEVSYLLQRIEQYDGVIILSTNNQNNIDAAFMRRIMYEVHFSLPSEEIRRELWKNSFAPEVPLGEVDFDFLSKNFTFSGASIKNIVLNACFLAAAEHRDVSMKHIISSIKSELLKNGKPVLASDFGKYMSYII